MAQQEQTQASVDPSQYPPLTQWKNEPTLATLRGDLEASKPSHDEQASKIKKWVDLLNVTGKAKPPAIKGRSAIQPKLVRRQAEWRYSALTEPFLGTNKLYKVSPVTHEDEQAARQNELLLNWQFRTKLNRIKFVDAFVHHSTNVVIHELDTVELWWTKALLCSRPVGCVLRRRSRRWHLR